MEHDPNATGLTLERHPTQPLQNEGLEADGSSAERGEPASGVRSESEAGTPHVPAAPTVPTAPRPPAWPAPWEAAPSGGHAPPEAPREAAGPKTGRLVPLFLAALLGAIFGTGATLVAADRIGGSSGVVRVAPPVEGTSRDAQLEGVAAVAAAVSPSIVRIDTRSQTFFGAESEGTGSGVIYRSDGYIITNHHVVEGATDVEVVLSTGETLEGRVIGTAAPVDDIAVVKVTRDNLPAATLGSISNTRVGELAVAIGAPFGFQGSVTAGIVSALHRNIALGDVRFTEAIQTDAPINPGNSGGALVNGRGEVIGINTAIIGGSGGNVGIGFAIPIDIARRDAEEIIETGRARRPLLGVVPETVSGTTGAFVAEVTPGTPAASAGIQRGDVITRVNDAEIKTGEDLILAISAFRVGDKVRVAYRRGGSTRTVEVTLIARPQ